MDERQGALEELAVGLVKKSEDIERMMKSFENIIGRALEGAEGRTRQSTDQIRSAITEVVDTATQRFANATEEMRQTAGSIRNELEQTRAELKKGVLDMPVEAKESTTAIRRAVTEQINALKELSEIVARSGRTVEVPDNRTARTPAPQVKPNDQPARRPELRETIEPERPQSAGRRPGGWMSDLLTNASRDEPKKPEAPRPAASPRSPLHVVESLNSLSVDIARAIDHEASVELWGRYRRGERDVFTRRLYTLKGQQTFDEIRRKYQADAEFKAAVDRYCDDFEKLLKDVARNDHDNVMAQTYLTSDTGKVYTMLAHASGRLK